MPASSRQSLGLPMPPARRISPQGHRQEDAMTHRVCLASWLFTLAIASTACGQCPWTNPNGSTGYYHWSNGQSSDCNMTAQVTGPDALELLPQGMQLGNGSSGITWAYQWSGCISTAVLYTRGTVTIPSGGG